MSYRLYLNEDGTVMVRLWQSGTVEVARRESRDAVWGPPVRLTEHKEGAVPTGKS